MAMIVDAYQFSFIGAMFFPSYFCVASGASAFIDYTSFLFYFFFFGGEQYIRKKLQPVWKQAIFKKNFVENLQFCRTVL